MSTPEIAGVRIQDLSEKVVSLDHRRTEIIAALDDLLQASEVSPPGAVP